MGYPVGVIWVGGVCTQFASYATFALFFDLHPARNSVLTLLSLAIRIRDVCSSASKFKRIGNLGRSPFIFDSLQCRIHFALAFLYLRTVNHSPNLVASLTSLAVPFSSILEVYFPFEA